MHDREEGRVDKQCEVVVPAIQGPIFHDDRNAKRMLKKIKLLFICHDDHWMVVDVHLIQVVFPSVILPERKKKFARELCLASVGIC